MIGLSPIIFGKVISTLVISASSFTSDGNLPTPSPPLGWNPTKTIFMALPLTLGVKLPPPPLTTIGGSTPPTNGFFLADAFFEDDLFFVAIWFSPSLGVLSEASVFLG